MVKIGQRQTRQRSIIHDIIMDSDRPLTIANLVSLAQERKVFVGLCGGCLAMPDASDHVRFPGQSEREKAL